jgi:hypothetical protein
LPSNIYQQLIQSKLVDENEMESITDVKYGEVADRITISVSEHRGEYVLVAYWCGQATDNFRGIQVGYRKGKLMGYAIFDEMGRDYLSFPPFSKKDEKNITLSILDLIEGGYIKLVENSKRE